MRYLIVNGDDFGLSRGVNRGIVRAHREGILTSTSMLVDAPASLDAAAMSGECASLSVGLHADLDEVGVGRDDTAGCHRELCRQVARFREITGREPTHLDSHHNSHRDPRLRSVFLDVASRFGLPLRDQSPARHVAVFYGQWGGETHAEQISPASLVRILRDELGEGVNELACHPGVPEPGLPSSYKDERAIELETLCSQSVRRAIEQTGIRLVGFRDLPAIAAGP